jgi:chemotaxis protein CheX
MLQYEQTSFTEEIEQTIGSIFETMLAMPVTAVEWPTFEEQNRMAASVHFAGSWSGVVMLEVSPQQACVFAGRFLSIDTPEAVDNDVRDVVGELTNMIGGNLKSAIAPDATLSIPEVVDGGDFSLRICGATVAGRHAFECEAGVFWVSLIQPRPAYQ